MRLAKAGAPAGASAWVRTCGSAGCERGRPGQSAIIRCRRPSAAQVPDTRATFGGRQRKPRRARRALYAGSAGLILRRLRSIQAVCSWTARRQSAGRRSAHRRPRGEREDVARSARPPVALDQDRTIRAPADRAARPDRADPPNCAYEPGAGWPSARDPSGDSRPVPQLGTVPNISSVEHRPVTFSGNCGSSGTACRCRRALDRPPAIAARSPSLMPMLMRVVDLRCGRGRLAAVV
jgi:hypothetical protein